MKKQPRIKICPAMQYAYGVMDGKIAAPKMVRLGVERHLNDLKNGADRGLFFDEEDAQRILSIFPYMKHSKGEWGGKPLLLEPWQQFKNYVMFGWKKLDDNRNVIRRFKQAYVSVPRKNGKSTDAAGIGLIMLGFDDEPGAEVYFAATHKKQALICFNEARNIVRTSDFLSDFLATNSVSVYEKTGTSKMEALATDNDNLSGFNTHCGVIDELHEHRNSVVVDMLKTSISARRQPLIYEITTAGKNIESVCKEHDDYTKKLLQGIFVDDAWFGSIYEIDEGDDPFDYDVWRKVNPNLGVSKKFEYMMEQSNQAKNMPTALNSFLRLDLNKWVSGEQSWISIEKWNACKIDYDDSSFKERESWGGLDLAETRDFSALVLTCPQPNGELYTLQYFWIPEANVEEFILKGIEYLPNWVRQGFIKTTPGKVTDFDVIEADIIELSKKYKIHSIAYDKRFGGQLVSRLKNTGIKMSEFNQGLYNMSPPTKETERLVFAEQIKHNGNPVMSWMMSNAETVVDNMENIRIVRKKSKNKVDGVIALIMSVGEWITDMVDGNKPQGMFGSGIIKPIYFK